jgi:hypothetical protein
VDGISGEHLIIPGGCTIKLISGQWQIYGSQGFEIEGVGILGKKGPLIEYCGPGGDDSTIKIERSGGWTIKGLMIESTGFGCAHATPVGVIIDNDRQGGYTMTDGVFERVMISPNFQGTHIPNWTGIRISPVANSNVEDIRLINSSVSCNQSPGAVGVDLMSSFNAKLEDFQHTQISFCPAGGINQQNGDILLRGMDTTGNSEGDIVLGAGSDPTLIEKIDSESSKLFAFTKSGGFNFPATLTANHVGFGAGSQGQCAIDFSAATGGQVVMIGNGSDVPPQGAIPFCANDNVDFTILGNQFDTGRGLPPSGSTFFLRPNGRSFGKSYMVSRGGHIRMGAAANYGTEDIGYGFFTQFGVEISGYGFNSSSLDDGHYASGLRIGKDVMYVGNQNIAITGMWPIPAVSVTCSFVGKAGSTIWRAVVFPKDSVGNRGGFTPGVGNFGCYNAAATLDDQNYLSVVWPRVTNAVSYDVVLLNPFNNYEGLLAQTVPDPGRGLTATARVVNGTTEARFNYTFPQFYESAYTTIYGAGLTVNAPSNFTLPLTVSALTVRTPYILATAPEVSSGFGEGSSIGHSNGTAAFTINIGSGGTATTGVLRLPQAANGWSVHCDDVTTYSPSVFVTKQTATSVATATLTQYNAAGEPSPWAASDTLVCQAAAY